MSAPVDDPAGPAGAGGHQQGPTRPAGWRRSEAPDGPRSEQGDRPPPAPPTESAAPTESVPPRRPRTERARRRAAAGFGRVDRSNRIVLLAVGAVFAAAGILGLLAGGGSVHWSQPADLWRHLSADAIADPVAWAASATSGCAVVAALAGWWVVRQLVAGRAPERLGTVTLGDSPRGRTTVEPSGIAGAVSRDLERVEGVIAARVRLRSLHPARLLAVVDVSTSVEATTLHHAFDDPLARATRVLGVRDVDAEVRVRFVDRPGHGRVR